MNKEGSNKGRKFYACPKGINQGCNFFLWANDDEAGNSNNSENWGPPPPPPGRGRGRGRGGSNTSKSSGSGGQRKCGNCGIPGNNIFNILNHFSTLPVTYLENFFMRKGGRKD